MDGDIGLGGSTPIELHTLRPTGDRGSRGRGSGTGRCRVMVLLLLNVQLGLGLLGAWEGSA